MCCVATTKMTMWPKVNKFMLSGVFWTCIKWICFLSCASHNCWHERHKLACVKCQGICSKFQKSNFLNCEHNMPPQSYTVRRNLSHTNQSEIGRQKQQNQKQQAKIFKNQKINQISKVYWFWAHPRLNRWFLQTLLLKCSKWPKKIQFEILFHPTAQLLPISEVHWHWISLWFILVVWSSRLFLCNNNSKFDLYLFGDVFW